MIRIAFCISTLEVGGAETQLVQLATRLPRDQFEPKLFVLAPHPRPAADSLVHVARQHDVPIEFLEARHFGHARRTLRQLTAELLEFRPALLQCFLAHANVAGALAGRRAAVPHILTGIRVADERWNLHRLLSRLTQPAVECHVCVSRSVAQFAIGQMHLDPARLRVIPNGVDVTRFRTAPPLAAGELGIDPRRRWLVYVGRLDRQKRLSWLLDRMPEILRQLPDHDLLLAGDGPCRTALQQATHKMGLDSRIHFLGRRDDIPQLLANAELLLLTSRWEGMPNAVLEAMAAARPVVATNVHGVAEVLGNEPQGQLVTPHDARAFVDQVVRFGNDPDLRALVGRRNQTRVATEFAVETMVDAYQLLYHDLLSRAL